MQVTFRQNAKSVEKTKNQFPKRVGGKWRLV